MNASPPKSFNNLSVLNKKIEIYFVIFMVIYGVGVCVSQSLMSLGSILLIGYFLRKFFVNIHWFFQKPSKETFPLLLSLAYILWTLLAWFVGEGFQKKDYNSLELFPLILIPSIALFPDNKTDTPHPRTWLYFWILFLTALNISSLYSIYQALIEQRMAIGFLRNPIYLSYNLLFSIVGLSIVIRNNTFSDNKHLLKAALISVVLGYFAMLATNSRMALLVTTLMLAFILLPWLWKLGFKKLIFSTLVLFSAFSTSEYIRKPYVRHRVAAALDFKDPSWQGRLKAWDHNKKIIKNSPILGVGPKQNAIHTASLENKWQNLWGPNVAIFAHSIYLQSLAESGWVGFLLLIFALLSYARTRRLVWPLLITFALGGITENILTNSKPYHSFLFWMLLLGLISPYSSSKDKPTKTHL